MKIEIKRGGKSIFLNSNEDLTISNALHEAKETFNRPCGGNGTCGKCKVKATGELSEMGEKEKRFLKKDEIEKGFRLACMTKILGDAIIFMEENEKMQVREDGMREAFEVDPSLFSYKAELTKPTIENPLADDSQIISHTKKPLSIFVIKDLPKVIKEAYYAPFITEAFGEIVKITSGENVNYGFAVDIGTTTVAVYLFKLPKAEAAAVISAHNAQSAYGADVISRIEHVMANGTLDISLAIRQQLNGMFSELCKKEGIKAGDVAAAVITGNTTMLHLLAGFDPVGISVVPFAPVSLFGYSVLANEIGIKLHENARIYFPRCMSAYIGGDITACLIAGGLADKKGINLLIDIGTNGEMALVNNGKILCCATAAGPAFEGANLHMGMAGVKGAIGKVYLENNNIKYETIGGEKPVGICGSGIIDVLKLMLDTGVLDESGLINEEGHGYLDFITEFDGMPAFKIGSSDVIITSKDIRNLQLAKSAMAAGVYTLIHESGVKEEDIDNLYIAGGFGSFIDKDSAARIGLFPASLKDKVVIMGNAAGSGAAMMLLSGKLLKHSEEIAKNAEVTELSANPYFMEKYIDCMVFE